jgi:SAM-dependent methyltransferase
LTERAGLRFGRVAEEYERVRSGYPAALVEKAYAVGGLEPGDAVVEIGPGTGKLTRELADRGLAVDAVEPDADLVAVARRAVSGQSVRFHIATFEDVELPQGAFRAVFAATSYHWVDPDIGWRKVASLLEPDGVFALLSHVGGTRGAFDEELIDVWRQVAPASYFKPIEDEKLWAGVHQRTGNVSALWSWLSRRDDLARPEAAELFREVELTREPVEYELPVEDYLARIRTTNSYLHLSSDDQRRLEEGLAAVLHEHGGAYPASHSAVLVTARRA